MEPATQAEEPEGRSTTSTNSLDYLRTLLAHWKPPQDMVFIGTALLVGIGTGLGAVAFRYLIVGVEWVGFQWIPQLTANWGKAYVVIVPALGGLIVGPLIYLFAREAKGHGVPEVMEAVALRGGRIRPVVAIVKSLASSISIGSGGSVGREGPIVQIGSALGSSVGQKLKLSDDRIRNLVACGAAAGIAATFNAPIAGVIFALEVILGQFSVRYFSTVVISAVAASVIGRAAFGNIPAFHIPFEYGINSLWEFAFYPFLGIAAAIVGVIFVRSLYWAEDQFEKWKSVPEWVQPAIGGLLLGGLAMAYPLFTGVTWDKIPQVYNVGYNIIEDALAGNLALQVVAVLLVLKMLATGLTLGSGGSGGVFAPSLFMGAMLGTAFELVVNLIFPGIAAPPGAYALVGMAAVFAAGAHAPITAIIILFELTGDYRIILPLMLTVVIATLLAQWMLGGESIYTLKLSRRGVKLRGGRDVDVMHGVSVEEVMAHEVYSIDKDTELSELGEVFNRTHHHGLLVLDEHGKVWGIVTITDYDKAVSNDVSPETLVKEIATSREKLLVAYPDESMGAAFRRMSGRGLGRLPVVSREDPRHLLGIIRRRDILRAYNLGLARRSELQMHTEAIQQRVQDTAEFLELTLHSDARAVGKTVIELAQNLPEDCVLVSIQRAGKLIVPHGNTVFQDGDRVTAFVVSTHAELVSECLSGK